MGKRKKLNFNSCNKEQKFLSSNGCIHLINDICTLDNEICVYKKKVLTF